MASSTLRPMGKKFTVVTHDAFLVDEEQTAVRDHLTFCSEVAFFVVVVLAGKHIVVGGDGLVGVCHEGVSRPRCRRCPWTRGGKLGAFPRCRRDADHCTVAGFEVTELFLERVNLCGTHKREVFGVEEQHHVLVAEVLIEREVVDDVASVEDSGFAEMGCLAAYEYCHGSGVGFGW